MDPHSCRILREAAERLSQQAAWYESYSPRYTPGPLRGSDRWSAYVAALVDGMDFVVGRGREDSRAVERPAEWKEFSGFGTPRRDACFRTAWFNEIGRQAGESFAEKRRAIFYNHTQEMQFAESLAAILFDTPEMPWAFHFDLARHCVDEIRHTRMGCTRLEQLGQELRNYPMLLQNYSVRANLDLIERFCLMTLVIEAGCSRRSERTSRCSSRTAIRFPPATNPMTFATRDARGLGHTWVPIMLRVSRDSRSVNELTNHCRDILEDALKDERRAG